MYTYSRFTTFVDAHSKRRKLINNLAIAIRPYDRKTLVALTPILASDTLIAAYTAHEYGP